MRPGAPICGPRPLVANNCSWPCLSPVTAIYWLFGKNGDANVGPLALAMVKTPLKGIMQASYRILSKGLPGCVQRVLTLKRQHV